MPTASGKPGPAARELAAINVGIIPDRPGQLLRQALQERLESDAPGAAHAYDLQVSYAIAGEPIAIQPDTAATRIRFIGRANWVLTRQLPPRTRLTSGFARSMDGLNVLDQQYFAADLETEEVQRRLAENLADQIALQLAVFFRKRAG
jgi:LPS-assembly lipoprotein